MNGSSGLIGQALKPFLEKQGHTVFALLRKKPTGKNTFFWNPETEECCLPEGEEFDVVINLAGENISDGRWSAERKKRILLSRILATKMLSDIVQKWKNPPKLFINASAIGYYGIDTGDQKCTENSPKGVGFLADVCEQWEEAVRVPSSVRVVFLRFGAVLTPKGGLLGKILPIFKLGLGGKLGTGEQMFGWIAIDDLVAIVNFVIQTTALKGAVNVVSPHPVSNQEFTKTLAKVLKRPAFFPMPVWAVKMIFGEMGKETALGNQVVVPGKLQSAGYTFKYPALEGTLRKLVKP